MDEPRMEIPSPNGSSSGTELEPTLNADITKTNSYLPMIKCIAYFIIQYSVLSFIKHRVSRKGGG